VLATRRLLQARRTLGRRQAALVEEQEHVETSTAAPACLLASAGSAGRLAWLVPAMPAVVALTVLTAATAPALAATPPVTGESPRALAATLAPAITVATSVAQSSFSGAGQTLDYSYLVTNSGDAPLTNVVVHDALAGVSPVTCPVSELAPGEPPPAPPPT